MADVPVDYVPEDYVPANIPQDAGEIFPEDLPEDASGDFPDYMRLALNNIFTSISFYYSFTSL